MRFSRRKFAAVAAVGFAIPLVTGVTSANADDSDQIPTETIDFNELPQGAELTTPWLQDNTIHTPDTDLPVGAGLDVTSLAPVGPSQFVAVDDTTGDGSANRLVRIENSGTTELAKEPVDTFAVSADGNQVAWTEWTGDSGRVVLADVDTGRVLHETGIDSEASTAGFVQNKVVLESGANAQVWTPGRGIADVPDAQAATATDAQRGLASVVTRFAEDPETGAQIPCSTVINTVDDNSKQWSSCEFTPVSFSPDGRYVWAKDTRADEALPDWMFLVDAQTGEKLRHVKIAFDGTNTSTTQRVSWEPGGSVVFDVWTGGEMAIVRCSTGAEGGCELATQSAPHEEPVDDAPLPYLLAERY